ncbi:MAG: hypothetical protein ACR2HN_08565 [Tepidiformaceae bacterium]
MLRAIERTANDCSRSQFIESASWEYIQRRQQHTIDEGDIAIYGANIERLNQEAEDVLKYQVLPRGRSNGGVVV